MCRAETTLVYLGAEKKKVEEKQVSSGCLCVSEEEVDWPIGAEG